MAYKKKDAEYWRLYYQKEKEEAVIARRLRRQNNKEQRLIKQRLWYQKNKEQLTLKKRLRYQEEIKKLGKTPKQHQKHPGLRGTESHIEYCRVYHAAKKYGVSLDQYRELIKSPCEICGKKSNALDHCHKTGKLRGALCRHCNWAIGHLKDDIMLLKKAISYLRKHNKV